MENIVTSAGNGTFIASGIAAFICGVVLLYLVMARTIKRREESGDES